MRDTYLYLHGFASSPRSAKAQALRDRFQTHQLNLIIPDLNQGDFYHLTLSRQIQQVRAIIQALDPQVPVTLIGSSFGGLTAAWVAEQELQVQRLILLAPAFEFLKHWEPKLGAEQLARWRAEGELQVYHYAVGASLPLQYEFALDLARYDDAHLRRSLPTLILHGLQDDVIPVVASQTYAAQRPWVEFIPLDSDHALGNVEPEIWQAVQRFCQL